MNAVLPPDIWVEEVVVADPRFHPRHDAFARTYEYRIGLVDEARSPFNRRLCWPLDDPVDRGLMENVTAVLPGTRSFKAFAKAGQPERGEMCIVHSAGWSGWDALGMVFTITANRFLRHTVRYLVGTMVEIGWKRRPPEDMSILLSEPDTDLVTSPPAPPEGLCLVRVEYPGS
jgi:tRNA pseudouridine38-40 synthase